MGITDKVSQLAGSVQDGVKNTSMSLFSAVLKIVTGMMIGLTLGLIGQEIMRYGSFSLMFVIVVVTGAIFKLISKWTVGAVLLFDLFCVLVALLLKLYIQVAP